MYSLVAIGSYALVSFLYQDVFTLDERVFKLMGEDVFLATIFGGVVSGIGSGLTIRFGGAIDGVEVLAIVFAKSIGVTVGQFVMAYNCVIYVFSMVALHNMAIGLYSIVSYFVGLKVVDFLVDGFDKGKAFTVITEHGNKVARAITETVRQGVTMTESKGFFSGTRRETLYCVVNRFEAVRLKNVIKSIDPDAFIAICEISEVVGNKTRYTSAKARRLHENAMRLKNLEQDVCSDAEMMEMIDSAIHSEKPHDEGGTITDNAE